MPLNVVANDRDIVAAINGFNSDYQYDYLRVRNLAAEYLDAPTPDRATPLALALSDVLSNWGAGKRKAPSVKSLHAIRETFINPDVQNLLVRFSESGIGSLGLAEGRQRVIGGMNTAPDRLRFDKELISILSLLSDGILVGNTNVTYPMKALLLLAGFMPALDSQVRKGLGHAGFSNVNVTRLLMPKEQNSNEANILTRLPFFLAECYATHGELLRQAAARSLYPWLVSEPGRLFDVLLFMQGSVGIRLLDFAPPIRGWQNVL